MLLEMMLLLMQDISGHIFLICLCVLVRDISASSYKPENVKMLEISITPITS